MTRILISGVSYFPDSRGGSPRIAYDLAHGFARHGHEVWYLCPDVTCAKPEYETDGQVKVLRYHLPRKQIGNGLFRHIQHVAAAQTLLRRRLPESPDVIHGHAPLQYLAARRLYGENGRGCFSFHSPAVEEMRITWKSQGAPGRFKLWFGIPLIRQLELEILKGKTPLAALSQYTRSLIAANYCFPLAERIHVIPGWTDLKRFHPLNISASDARIQLGWPDDQPIFFTLRRLEPRMGLDNLLRAYHILFRRGYRFFAVISGTGSQASILLRLRRHLHLDSRVHFTGSMPEDLLPLAYGACDASVVPTVQLECFGLIALESLACGRCVLVTPIGALPEVVGNFEPNWIAQGNSPEEIAMMLAAFLDGKLPQYNAATVTQLLCDNYNLKQGLEQYARLMNL